MVRKKLIIQIINFDRIFSNDIKALPTIFNNEPELSFERYYKYDKEAEKIILENYTSKDKTKVLEQLKKVELRGRYKH